MPHVQRSRFAARSYELDSYRHLNNAVYASWFERARLDWLKALGFSYDGFADRRQWFVVARTEVDFRHAVHLGDLVEVETQVAALGRSSVRFRQVMRRAGEPVCEAATGMAFAGDGGGSIAIPDDFRAAVGPLAPA